MRFEVFMVEKIHAEVLQVVMPYGVAEGYQHFRGPCCLYHLGEYLIATLHSITTQMTLT